MLKADNNIYDAVIIGAGISGLVCGCYLAKAGMNVLIAEQHFKPGGYCASFKRQSFTFDAAAHSFGSYRKGGIMNKVLKELDIDKKLNIKRYEPSDTIISPDHKISFWSDVSRTVQELQRTFPHEASGINNFFNFLQNSRPFDLATLRNKTFKDLLNRYLADEKLKSILSFPILGVGGLPSSSISAFSAVVLFTEFFLDGGYYPTGGMQVLPDTLAKRFRELGGELRFRCPVTKIKVNSDKIEGVILDNEIFIPSKYVVSCCDVRQTFLELLEQRIINKGYLSKIKKMKPSLSFLIAYLGVDGHFSELSLPGVSFWVMPHYDVEDMYSSTMKNGSIGNSTPYMIHVPPDQKSLEALMIAPFKYDKYWSNNKNYFLENFIKKIEAVFPHLSKHIVYKEVATPHTLYRYTLNFQGAGYGWARTPAQSFIAGLTQVTPIENLYLSGHWTTQTQGISGVAYIGHETAKLILKKEKRILGFCV